MKVTLILAVIYILIFAIYGYFFDKYLGGCGIALCAVVAIISCLIDIKDAIKGVK